MSRQWTGISVTVVPRRRQVASNSTSKANPAVRRDTAAALASGPEKNLNPHWVSEAPGIVQRAIERNRAAPAARTALDRASTTDVLSARDPMTRGCPATRRLMATSRADSSVAMSASQNPTNGARVASSPSRTAAPLPGRSQRSSPTGTGPGGHARTTSAVESELALSTTRIAVRNGRVAAFSQRTRRPPGSRRSSFRAGTTISTDAG
jgi:hypothetical protein